MDLALGKLYEAAEILEKIASDVEHNEYVDTAITTLKQANILSSDEEIERKKAEFSKMASENISDVVNSLVDFNRSLPVGKSASLGSAVTEGNLSGKTDRWASFHDRVMKL